VGHRCRTSGRHRTQGNTDGQGQGWGQHLPAQRRTVGSADRSWTLPRRASSLRPRCPPHPERRTEGAQRAAAAFGRRCHARSGIHGLRVHGVVAWPRRARHRHRRDRHPIPVDHRPLDHPTRRDSSVQQAHPDTHAGDAGAARGGGAVSQSRTLARSANPPSSHAFRSSTASTCSGQRLGGTLHWGFWQSNTNHASRSTTSRPAKRRCAMVNGSAPVYTARTRPQPRHTPRTVTRFDA
jgi:hypothetical protein